MQESFSRQLSHEYPSEKNSSADSSHVKLKICKVTLFHTFSPITTRHHHRYIFTKCYDNSKDNADAIKITPHTQVTYATVIILWHIFFCTIHPTKLLLKAFNIYGGHSFGFNLPDGWGVFSFFFESKLQITSKANYAPIKTRRIA